MLKIENGGPVPGNHVGGLAPPSATFSTVGSQSLKHPRSNLNRNQR